MPNISPINNQNDQPFQSIQKSKKIQIDLLNFIVKEKRKYSLKNKITSSPNKSGQIQEIWKKHK